MNTKKECPYWFKSNKDTRYVDGNITIGCEKDNILKLNGENIKFVDGKYTIENASAGETYIFTE